MHVAKLIIKKKEKGQKDREQDVKQWIKRGSFSLGVAEIKNKRHKNTLSTYF